MAAVMATGAPKPAVPSRKAPNEKAISNACNLLSEVTDAMKCLMISNCPLFTVILNKKTAVITIQQMGNKPYKAPFAVESSASFAGIPYINMEIRMAISNSEQAGLVAFHLFYNKRPENKEDGNYGNQY